MLEVEVRDASDCLGVGARRVLTDAESEEAEHGDGMRAQAPAQVPLTRLSNLVGHGDDGRRLIEGPGNG